MSAGTRQFVINKSLTIDGQGYTVTTKKRGFGVGNVNNNLSSDIDVTFKDITIKNTTDEARCIDTRGHIGSLTLDGVNLSTDGAPSGYTQPLTIGGNQSTPANVIIKNSVIETNVEGTATYYAIITFNPVAMNISNSTLKGWACIYAKGPDGSAGSNGSVFNIDKCNIISKNHNNGVSNAFAAFSIEAPKANNVKINVTNSEIEISALGDQKQFIATGYPMANGGVFLGEGNTVTLAGKGAFNNLYYYLENVGYSPALYITGGTFNADPTPYVADGYKAVDNGDGTWTVEVDTNVYAAKIGYTKYGTLADAIAAAENGETITLISDVTLEETFVVALGEKAVTLDLGGKTLTGRTNLTSGNLTLQNGNVVNTGGQPLNVYGSETQGAQNYSVLSVASDVTVTGKYGVCVFGKTATTNGYGAVVNVEGKLIANNGIFVSGNLGNNVADDMNNIVNISGTLTSESDVAVALNGWATVNVQSGAKITGNTGIAVKRGVLNVYDGATVTANGQWVTPPAANNSGTEPTGAAVSMTNTYNNYGAMAVNIAGGSFTSANGEALYKANQTYSNAATFTVTGGSFSSDPSAYVAAGYKAVENGNGIWTVQELQYVAKIDDSYYATLEEAFAEVPTDGTQTTITMIGDVAYSVNKPLTVQANKNIVLDLNGHTISHNAPEAKEAATINNLGTLTINDSSAGKTGKISMTGIPDSNWLYGIWTINNWNTLTINGGTIENLSDRGLGFAVHSGAYGRATTTNINGGIISHPKYCALCLYYQSSGTQTATISGGEIIGDASPIWFQICTDNPSYNVTINGGRIVSTSDKYLPIYIWAYNSGFNASNVNLSISGGTVQSNTPESPVVDWDDAESAFVNANKNVITGGTFNVDPSSQVADGYEAVQSESGNNWNVKKQEGLSSMDYTTFNTALLNANGVWDTPVNVILKESQRDIQNSNTTAQFYLNRIKSINVDGTEGNITIKNVTFTYEPDDNDINLTVGELQPPLTGTLTIEDCTFIGVSVSPWGMLNNASSCPQKAEFKNCTFKDLSGRYGVHQNKAIELIVTGCTFENMQRGIHTNCPSAAAVTIKNNSFTGIDATKGVICLAEGNVFTNTEFDVSGNNAAGQTFLRQLNTTITAAQLNAILADNTYGTAYTSGSTIPSE